MLLSILIPAYNEQDSLTATLSEISSVVTAGHIAHEIIVVNDNSTDSTQAVLTELKKKIPALRVVINTPPNGYGRAVRLGLTHCKGEAVIIVTADAADDPADILRFYYEMVKTGCDCVFGNRFLAGGKVTGYPMVKRCINRLGNRFICNLFGFSAGDLTNSFKMYKRELIKLIQPLESEQFELTLELVLKTLLTGACYTEIPNNWQNRTAGKSKMKILQSVRRYGAVILQQYLLKKKR